MAHPEVIIPPWVKPVSPYEPQMIDDQIVQFTPRFGRGLTQRQAWGDPLWGWKLKYEAMRGDERAAMTRVIGEQRGGAVNIRMTPGMAIAGSFPATELMTYGAFENGVAGWSTVTGKVTLSATERVLRVTQTASGDDGAYPTAGVAVSSGAAYVARAFISAGVGVAGNNSGNWFRLGASPAASDYGETGGLQTSKIHQLTAVMTGTALYPHLIHYGESVGNGPDAFFESSWVSVTRCACVASHGLNGNGRMYVQNLPPNTNGLLLPRDFFEINGELKRTTMSLNSNGSGAGWLRFRPAMATIPAHGDPVIIGSPYGRFTQANNPRITERFGTYTDIELDLIESYS